MDHRLKKGITHLLLILILALAAYLRFQIIDQTIIDRPIQGDAVHYYLYAYHLKKEGIYSRANFQKQEAVIPDALRPPLYPLFISAFWHDDHRILLKRVQIAQAVLSTLSVLLIFLIARLVLPDFWSLLAALLTALSPHLIATVPYLLTETLFTFLLLLALWLTALAPKRLSLALAAGACIALAALTRPTLQYFIFIPPLLWFWLQGQSAWKITAYLVFGFALIYSPWLIRNLMVLEQATDPSLMINTLHHGIYPDFTYAGQPESKGFPYRYDPRSEEISQSLETVLAEIKRRFTEEPARHLYWYLIGKPIYLFSWDIIAGMGDVFIYNVQQSPYFVAHSWHDYSHRLMGYLHWPIVLLALGISFYFIYSRPSFIALLLALTLFYFMAVHMIGAPFPRYSIPLRPILYLLSSWALYLVWKRIQIRFLS